MSFDALWAEVAGIGRAGSTGGYRRYAWTGVDAQLRAWFTATAQARGLSVTEDRAGNQWAWWGDPDARAGVATGSHLDSVPDGGAFDGPLGIVAAFAAVDALQAAGVTPPRPLGVVNFAEEEGARFGVACAGSRLLTGALDPRRALALRDRDGVTLAEALTAAGRRPADLGADPGAVRRVDAFVELHVEQGRGLVALGAPVAVADAIWPHGRYRAELPGEANHAGTTRLADRRDPTLHYARLVLAARASAERHGALATCGQVTVTPGAVNAVPGHVTAWVDARAERGAAVRAVVADLAAVATGAGGTLVEESWTAGTAFDPTLRAHLAGLLTDPPVLGTGAGHDAGILAAHGIPTAMLFVRNPTGVSHAPAEFAERDDCLAGVAALTTVLTDLLQTGAHR